MTAMATAVEPANIALARLGVADPDPTLADVLTRTIVTVAAWKGGVGKTEIAKELAWLMAGVLVDLDWDRGGASRAWGYRHETRSNAPLLDAFDTGKTPRPLVGGAYRSDLVPSNPALVDNQPAPDKLASQIDQWSQHWRRPIVIDTHPGGGDATYGALAAAKVVVVPIVLETKPLEALAGMLDELRTYNILIVPNMISASPPGKMVDRLQRITDEYHTVSIGPKISRHTWLSQRQYHMAVAARTPVPARSRRFVEEIIEVGRAVIDTSVRAEQ